MWLNLKYGFNSLRKDRKKEREKKKREEQRTFSTLNNWSVRPCGYLLPGSRKQRRGNSFNSNDWIAWPMRSFHFVFVFFTLTVDVIELIIRINNKLVYRFQLELDWDFVLFHFWFIWSIFNLHQILLHTNVWHLFNEISFIWLIQNGKSQQTNPLLKPTKMEMNGQNRFLIKKAFIQVQSTQQAY